MRSVATPLVAVKGACSYALPTVAATLRPRLRRPSALDSGLDGCGLG
jgi:hypothetical protein